MPENNTDSFIPVFTQMLTGDCLSIAALCAGTYALGPGWRAVVWVQGCALRCPCCIAADWWEFKPAQTWNPEELAHTLLSDPSVTGITLSGGEPMQQAAGLTRLIQAAREIRPMNVIAYSGYLLSQLQAPGVPPAIHDFLEQLDVLIDGPYRIRNDNELGLRGSTNQTIHFFTDQLKQTDFTSEPRKAEVYIENGSVLVAGIPSHTITPLVERAIRGWVIKEVDHERL